MINKILVSEDVAGQVSSYQEAIKLTGEKFIQQKMVTPEYIKACISREKDFPTGLVIKHKIGIAIPHGNQKYVKVSGISFLRLYESVEFGLMEDATQQVPCKYIFNLALFQGEQQVKMLQQLMKLFRSDAFLKRISTDKLGDIQNYLTQKLIFN